jgi:CRP-like cAMP-binding protein
MSTQGVAPLSTPMHARLDRGRIAAPAPKTAPVPGESNGRRATRLLRQLPLFEGVLSESTEAPFDPAQVMTAATGTVLFEAGQPAAVVYVIVCGQVRLLLGEGPLARVLAVMGRGDTIGLAALLREDRYPVTAVVAQDALLVGLPEAALRRMMSEHPGIAARLVGDMGAKLARFVRDVGGFTQRSARARVARLLQDLHRTGVTEAGEVAYTEPKRVIALRLAMTPETLSRELHVLAAQGLIESRRTWFRVLDVAGLARAADDRAPGPGGG